MHVPVFVDGRAVRCGAQRPETLPSSCGTASDPFTEGLPGARSRGRRGVAARRLCTPTPRHALPGSAWTKYCRFGVPLQY